jgi:hypothetical protein
LGQTAGLIGHFQTGTFAFVAAQKTATSRFFHKQARSRRFAPDRKDGGFVNEIIRHGMAAIVGDKDNIVGRSATKARSLYGDGAPYQTNHHTLMLIVRIRTFMTENRSRRIRQSTYRKAVVVVEFHSLYVDFGIRNGEDWGTGRTFSLLS